MQKNRFHMAPLHGYTSPLFRKALLDIEPQLDSITLPFLVASKDYNFTRHHLEEFLSPQTREIEIIPQILGNDPDSFISLSNNLFSLGYKEVNWNIGCPFKNIARKFRGAIILSQPDFIDSFLKKVLVSIQGNLSVKMRTGMRDHSEVTALMGILNSYPLKSVILHPRTGIQKYEGRSDIEVFKKATQLSSNRLIYNGDIDSRGKFNNLKRELPKTFDWMIGRGLISNPFLVKMIRSGFQPSNSDFEDFHNKLFETLAKKPLKGEKYLNIMKGYWRFFKNSFGENSEKVFITISSTKSPSEYLNQVKRVLENFSFKPPL